MNYKTCLVTLPVLAFLCLCSANLSAQTSTGKRIYVATFSSRGFDGKSWDTAYKDLQSALQQAQKGDTIWISHGFFRTSETRTKEETFKIPNGVVLIGGFRGDETSLRQRNHLLNFTILSGLIGVDPIDQTSEIRAHHVLTLTDVDSSTVLDGLIIERGDPNDLVYPSGITYGLGGGAIIRSTGLNPYANPTFINCTFRNNLATLGGAIHSDITASKACTQRFINCTFMDNAARGAAAVRIFSSNPGFRLFFQNCRFEKNYAYGYPGTNIAYFGAGDLEIESTSFVKNQTPLGSGSVTWENVDGNLHIKNCTFTEELVGLGDMLYIGHQGQNKQHRQIIIENTSFSKCRSGQFSPLINIGHDGPSKLALLIRNCQFNDNTYDSEESLMSIWRGPQAGDLSATIDRCVFANQITDSSKEKLILFTNLSNTQANIQFNISNSIFYNNPGNISIRQEGKDQINAKVINATFFSPGPNIISNSWGNTDGKINLRLENSVLWSKKEAALNGLLQNANRPALEGISFNHCLFSAMACKPGGDTSACGRGNIYGVYPRFQDTLSASGLQLAPGSVAINAGRWLADLPFTDIVGKKRVQDCKPDLGAYESPATRPQDSLRVQSTVRGTGSGAATGAISIQTIVGGAAPYQLHWENGDTTRQRRNLRTGTYQLSITDQLGCVQLFSFSVPLSTATQTPQRAPIRLFPNPLGPAEDLQVELSGLPLSPAAYRVFDLLGRPLSEGKLEPQKTQISIPFNRVPAGIYYLQLLDRQGRQLALEKVLK
jgi:hypothetical protein